MKDLFRKNIEILKNEVRISEDEIFDFIGYAGQDEFLENYIFCQTALDDHQKYGIFPSFFYFRNCNDISANARKTKNGYYLIGLNKGLSDFFYRNLVLYFNLENFDNLQKYKLIEDKLEQPIGELMYKSILHFTFYHELGHLIQFTEFVNKELNESLVDGNEYNIDNHCDELDADLFASISLSTHLYQYFEKYFNCKLDKDSIESYLSILTSSIFIYFLSFAEYRDGYYLKKKSHPHPILRIISATASIVGYFQNSLKMKSIEIEINQSEIIQETFRVSEIFINKFIAEKEFDGFFKVLTENIKEINEYYDFLIKKIIENPRFSVNRRNELIKNQCK